MDFQLLVFPASPLNRAISDLVAHLGAIEDLNGARVFENVRPGLYIPQQEYAPRPEDVPACFIWDDSASATSNSRPMIITEAETVVSLYLLWYDFGHDSTSFGPGGVATKRSAMVDYVIKKLQAPELAPPVPIWDWPPGGFTFTIDHTNAYRRVTDQVQLTPPWYATRIDLRIWSQGVSDTFGDNEE